MHHLTTLSALAALALTATAQEAPAVNGSPLGVMYTAVLPKTGENEPEGTVDGSSAPNGMGANFQVVFRYLPEGMGNLSYAIHSGRVGRDGDCSSTGDVLDPFGGVQVGECEEDEPAACKVGDLSGKQGAIATQSGGAGTGYFSDIFVDEYLSLEEGNEAFFGTGSLVVMKADGSILSCANFVDANSPPTGGNSTSNSSSNSTSSSGSGSNDEDSDDADSSPSETEDAEDSTSASAAPEATDNAGMHNAAAFGVAGVLGLGAAFFL